MTTAYVRQYDFAGRCDNGNETGATWKYADGSCGDTEANAENRDWTQNTGQVFRVRFQISETAGANKSSAYQLRYSTGGAYELVTGSTPIQTAESAEDGWTITDGDSTTEQMAGSQSFISGEYSEDALTEAITIKNDDTELEFCLTIDAAQVNDEDTITLQVYYSDGNPLSYYDNTPTITVNKVGTAHSISESDNLGASDGLELATTHARSDADNAGIADDLSLATEHVRSQSATAGFSDDVTAQLGGATRTVDQSSTLGIADDASVTTEHARSESETLAVTDSLSVETSHARTESDTAGLSDSVTVGRQTGRSESDTAGFSDNVTAQLGAAPKTISRSVTAGFQTPALTTTQETDYQLTGETLGVSDSLSVKTSHARDFLDTAGASDSLNVATEHNRSSSDTAGLADNVTVELAPSGPTISRQDTLGATDSATVETAHARDLAETIGVSDSLAAATAQARDFSDTAGIADGLTAGRQVPASQADTAGFSDNATVVLGAMAKTISESATAGLADSISVISEHARELSETAGLADALSAKTEHSRSFSATTGIADSLAIYLHQEGVKTISVSDVLGGSDSTLLASAIARILQASFAPTDSVSVQRLAYTPVVLPTVIRRTAADSQAVLRAAARASDGKIRRTAAEAPTQLRRP